MDVTIVGAGPAGLYAAIRLARARPGWPLRVVEQNPRGATFGFGVVFSDQALGFLRDDDPETADLIEPHMTRWSDIVVAHRGERVAIDGVGFAGIGRLELLALLQGRAAEMGIRPEYGVRVEHTPTDGLVVGADGLNSAVRAGGAFGERIDHLSNRFAWYGADRDYDALTQSFVETEHGPMNAHHYSYAPGRATFIVEMGPDTFDRTGFAAMDEGAYRAECERLFADQLDGASLVPNNSVWRRFPVLTCERFHDGRSVLVGDALHTAHFSIGSGTRLALEDVQALVRAFEAEGWDVDAALPRYEAERRPVLDKITRAALRSAAWYERFGEHMALDPWDFAASYVTRAGRLDGARLRAMAPRFAAGLDARGIDVARAA